MSAVTFTAKETADFLKAHDNYLILTHASPDGDTLGSGFGLLSALLKAGKKAKVICPDEIPQKFSFLLGKECADFEYETVIAVDVADQRLLGHLESTFDGKIDLCIDHHQSNTGFAKHLYLERDSAAACETVYNVITELGVEIDTHIAGCLYTGIATDTGCFKFSNTTPRTHRYAALLMELGADYSEINRVMFEVKSKEKVAIERLVLEGIEFYFDGKCAVIAITKDMLNKTGCPRSELDSITALSRQIEGVMIGVTLKEQPSGNFKVSLRTFEPYSASDICRNFGGGGHVRAAGCEFSCSLEEAKQQLLKAVGEVLGENVEQ